MTGTGWPSVAGHGPATLALLVAAASVAGLARGFSGFGGALIFVPLASAAIGPKATAPLLLLIDLLPAAALIPDAWRRADRGEVTRMALGAVASVPLGVYLLANTEPRILRWAVALVVIALFGMLASGWRYRGAPRPPLTIAVGSVAGLFSGVAQIGGPPVVAYWLGGASPPRTVRANVVLYFAVSSVLTGVSYLAGGLVTAEVVLLALATTPFYAAALYAGSRLFGRAGEGSFRAACLALIAIAAVLGLPVLDGAFR